MGKSIQGKSIKRSDVLDTASAAMRQTRIFWIDQWSKPELEAVMRSSPGIALHYRDIITTLAPQGEQ